MMVKTYFLAQVSNFNNCSLSGGDMMIDPDIEACHELRCTCDSGMFLTVVLAFRGWWQAEGSRTNLKSMSVQVSVVIS